MTKDDALGKILSLYRKYQGREDTDEVYRELHRDMYLLTSDLAIGYIDRADKQIIDEHCDKGCF